MSSPLRFGVIGRDIGYSKSGDIFAAIFKELDQAGEFELLSIEEEQLPACLARLRSGELSGCSVTIPYKSTVIKMLDQVDPTAVRIQAVNSITARDGKLIGFNTDQFGFAYPLLQDSKIPKLPKALVLGCGGAARAVMLALKERLGTESILLLGRSSEKLEECQRTLALDGVSVGLYDSEPDAAQIDFDIVVNCTPLGGPNHPDQSPLPKWFKWEMTKIYYDLSYNHDNRAVADAAAAGLQAFDGSAMLVAQALQSLKLWRKIEIPFEPIHTQLFGGQSA